MTVWKIRWGALALLLLSLAVLPVGSDAAAVRQVRLPAKGMPAFELAVPPGWSQQIDQKQNLSLYNPAHTAVVRLTMLEDDDLATASTVDVATLYFKMIAAAPSTESVPSAVGGYAGESFQSTMPAKGGRIDVALTVVKIDDRHMGVVTVMKNVGFAAADLAAVNNLVAHIRILATL